jgi:hypothetical protein
MRLTREEMLLLAGLCLALVTGGVVKHYRDLRKAESPSPATAESSVSDKPGSKRVTLGAKQ